jgi:hypothetical protein
VSAELSPFIDLIEFEKLFMDNFNDVDFGEELIFDSTIEIDVKSFFFIFIFLILIVI